MQKKIYSYSVLYETDPEGGFVAYVPSLAGCHSQGETLEEAEENIKEAIEVYLQSVAANQETIPRESKSFYGTVNVPVLLKV